MVITRKITAKQAPYPQQDIERKDMADDKADGRECHFQVPQAVGVGAVGRESLQSTPAGYVHGETVVFRAYMALLFKPSCQSRVVQAR